MGKDSQLRARGAVQGKNQSPCDAKRKIAMATDHPIVIAVYSELLIPDKIMQLYKD